MRVLFFCWEYPPIGSGIGRYIAEMSSALREAGHFTVIATSRAPGLPEREELESGVIYRMYDRSDMRTRALAEKVGELARTHAVDWIEGADHWGECSALLRLKNRPPVVVKLHYNDVLRISRYAQAWFPWQRPLIDLACLRQWRSIHGERMSMSDADYVISPCHRILDECRKQGIRMATRQAVVANPIRTKIGWSNRESDVPTVLLVGRLDMGKGLPYIRPMVEQLAPEFPGLRLEIAGGDSYARGLGSIEHWFKRELGDMHRFVSFLGLLGQAALDEAYRRAWVVMVPSRWDTFPQVVLEAMVRSKPIVASSNGGMPDMLAGTDCVIADPVGDAFSVAMAGMLRSHELRMKAGASAREKSARAYAPGQISREYLSVLKGLA